MDDDRDDNYNDNDEYEDQRVDNVDHYYQVYGDDDEINVSTNDDGDNDEDADAYNIRSVDDSDRCICTLHLF